MIHKGDWLIVWDADIQDMYVATAVKDEPDELAVNPLVRIHSMIAYPMQRTIGYRDIAMEHAPIPEGTICRMKLVYRGRLGFCEDYEASMQVAMAQMVDSVRGRIKGGLTNLTSMAAQAEYDILARHALGQFGGRPRPLMDH